MLESNLGNTKEKQLVSVYIHNQFKVNNMYSSKGAANDVLDNQVVISSNV